MPLALANVSLVLVPVHLTAQAMPASFVVGPRAFLQAVTVWDEFMARATRRTL